MSNQSSKVVRFHKSGDASVLTIDSLKIAQPQDDELRIKVKYIGLNRAELMYRSNAYLETPELPSRIGYEASGVVDAIGKNVYDFKIGDRVSTIPAFSMGKYGVYAEHAVVPQNVVAKIPIYFNFQQGTSIWMQYITAYGALINIGELKKGQYILITAASSSVGIAAMHISQHLGITVIATTRGKKKKTLLLDQGADHVIQTDSEDLIALVNEITNNKGVDLVFDPIGGPILNQLAEVASVGSKIIEYGALDSKPTPYPLFTALAKGLIIQGYTIFEITKDKDKLEAAKDFLYSLFITKKVEPLIDKVFNFDEIQQAHEYMESNQQVGKIIVRV